MIHLGLQVCMFRRKTRSSGEVSSCNGLRRPSACTEDKLFPKNRSSAIPGPTLRPLGVAAHKRARKPMRPFWNGVERCRPLGCFIAVAETVPAQTNRGCETALSESTPRRLPTPRGLPSSVKQLRTSGLYGPSWRTITGNPETKVEFAKPPCRVGPHDGYCGSVKATPRIHVIPGKFYEASSCRRSARRLHSVPERCALSRRRCKAHRRSLRWYQSLFGQEPTSPARPDFDQLLGSDGTVLLCLHEWAILENTNRPYQYD